MDTVELISKIHAGGGAGVTRADIERVLDSFADVVAEAAQAGETVRFRRFGMFKPRVRPSRNMRKVSTGEPIVTKAKRVVVFKAGKDFADRLTA